MDIVLFSLLTSLFLCYSIIHLLTVKGLRALRANQKELSAEQPPISIIVAARNEAANIGTCLQSLVSQAYPAANFEIVVVDDRSADRTSAIVSNYQLAHPCIKLVRIEKIVSDLPPKKNALTEGIRQSSFGILAFTDADCIAPEFWLASLAKEFRPDVGIVAGYSPIEQRFPVSLFARWGDSFLRYLEIKNSIGAAASIGLRASYLCTGRNLAYRKIVFNEVGGFQGIKHSISGDDDLFIQLVQNKTPWKIRYMLSSESYVETKPPGSFRAFVNQRKRHFSAGKYYPLKMKAIFVLIHSYSGLALFFIVLYPLVGLTMLFAKLAIDAALFYKGTVIFGGKRLRAWFVPLEILSIFYNLLVGPLGFFGSFKWKESKS